MARITVPPVRDWPVVGGMLGKVAPFFANCTGAARMDDAVAVPNEEQGQPIAICQGRKQPRPSIRPALKPLD